MTFIQKKQMRRRIMTRAIAAYGCQWRTIENVGLTEHLAGN